MRHHDAASILLAASAAVALAGCGLSDPYTAKQPSSSVTSSNSTSTRPSTTTTNADPVPERGGTIPPGARATQSQLATGAAQATPQSALEQWPWRQPVAGGQRIIELKRQR